MAKRKYQSDETLAATFAEALEGLPNNYLMCRDMRHSWDLAQDFYVAPKVNAAKGNIRRDLLCLRCGMGRVERYVQTKFGLEKVGQTYKDPEGYRIHGVPRGNKPSSIIHGEQFRRAMNKAASAQKVAKSTSKKPGKAA